MQVFKSCSGLRTLDDPDLEFDTEHWLKSLDGSPAVAKNVASLFCRASNSLIAYAFNR